LHVQAQNFPRLTFGDDFERAAAHFAVRREALRSDAGVHHEVKRLPAEWALNLFGNFHSDRLRPSAKTATATDEIPNKACDAGTVCG
jgi:hypothetical protein